MAPNPKPLLSLLLIFSILLAVAAREIPTDSKNTDMKQPQFLIDHDGSILIPGIGRFMVPKKGHKFNPFTYNPVTGTSGGGPAGGVSSSGTGAGASHSYVPGGDDTLLPNPGDEVPIPGSGGSSPPATAQP